MSKAQYKEEQRLARIYKRNNRVFDPILDVADASVDCTCFITIAGDYTVLDACRRHAIKEFCGNGSSEAPWKTTPQQDRLLDTLTAEDYD